MIRKLARSPVLAFVLVLALSAASGKATVLFESVAPTDSLLGVWGGATISNYSYLGTRFYVPQAWQVVDVGGVIQGGDWAGLFAAVVSLSGPTALPRMGGDYFNPTPFNDADVMAHAVFVGSGPASAETRIDMAVTLQPGWYGLVFGSYLWGAYGIGGMPGGAQSLPGTSFFGFYDSVWRDTDPTGQRFVVEGVPEPDALVLVGLAAVAALWSERRRGRLVR